MQLNINLFALMIVLHTLQFEILQKIQVEVPVSIYLSKHWKQFVSFCESHVRQFYTLQEIQF